MAPIAVELTLLSTAVSEAAQLAPLSICVCLLFLLLASFHDWLHREVPDRTWVALLFSATPLLFLRMMVGGINFIDVLIAVVPVALIVLILCELGFFGGADAKAIICIGVAVPIPFSIAIESWPVHASFPLAVLTNALIAAESVSIYALYRNIRWSMKNGSKWLSSLTLWRRLIVLVSSYPVSLAELGSTKFLVPMDPKHPLAHVNGEGQQSTFRIQHSTSEDVPGKVWVLATPQLPMLVFITVGFALALLRGDILNRAVLLLYGG